MWVFRADLKVWWFWAARTLKDFPQSGRCSIKGSAHSVLVPEGFAGGQQQLGINEETDGEPVERSENRGGMTALLFWRGRARSTGSSAAMLQDVDHLLKVPQRQLALGFGWHSKMENAAPKPLHEACCQTERTQQSSPSRFLTKCRRSKVTAT